MITPVEVLGHRMSRERRVVFSTSRPDVFIVVKFFDDQQSEHHTFKVFRGVYAKVRAFWVTTVDVLPPHLLETQSLISRAREVIAELSAVVNEEIS